MVVGGGADAGEGGWVKDMVGGAGDAGSRGGVEE